MKKAICTINNRTYEAVNFEEAEHFELIKAAMICPQCSQQAFYRRVTKNGREACFGASHTEGCTLANNHDDLQDVGNEVNATGQRIVVNFGNAIVTDTNQTMDLNTLLQSLMESEEFISSGAIIEVPGRGEYVASELFVKFSDITDEHLGSYCGFWGNIKYAKVTGNTMWLNSGGPDDACANLDKSYFDTVYQRYNIKDETEITGANILVFGELKKSKIKDKKFVLITDPDNFTLQMPVKKTGTTAAGSAPATKIVVVNKTSNSECKELYELIASITDVNMELAQYIQEYVKMENAVRADIDSIQDRIADLVCRAGLLAEKLVEQPNR